MSNTPDVTAVTDTTCPVLYHGMGHSGASHDPDFQQDGTNERQNVAIAQCEPEYVAQTSSGYLMLVLFLIVTAIGCIAPFLQGDVLIISACVFLFLFIAKGFYVLQPNQAAAIMLFGSYNGTDRATGLRWVWPWMGKTRLSARANNIISEKIKVNDLRGNPIEMAAQVVWRVTDTAQALFDVDDYKAFVKVQIEAAVRTIGSRYPYDDFEHQEVTLRGNSDQVRSELRTELIKRLTRRRHYGRRMRLHPPRLCVRDRGSDASAPAGPSSRGGTQDARRGRGRNGGNGARHAVRKENRRARYRPPRRAGLQPDGGAVQRTRHAAHRKCGDAASISPSRSAHPRSAASSAASAACATSTSCSIFAPPAATAPITSPATVIGNRPAHW